MQNALTKFFEKYRRMCVTVFIVEELNRYVSQLGPSSLENKLRFATSVNWHFTLYKNTVLCDFPELCSDVRFAEQNKKIEAQRLLLTNMKVRNHADVRLFGIRWVKVWHFIH